ncbi:MAG: hypothetical protein FWG37_04985, partial [Clostridia bacterium]|nr:hypothetical protein [Clostridia bacterium]
MAVLEMSRILIQGLHHDRKAVLEELHKKEIVEVLKPNADGLRFLDTAETVVQMDQIIQSVEASLSVLKGYCPDKPRLLNSRRSLPIHKYHMTPSQADETLCSVRRIVELSDRIREHREAVEREPADVTEAVDGAKRAHETEIDACVSEIKEYAGLRREIELFHDQMCLRSEKYQVLSKTGMTEYTFLIEGYIPKKNADEIKRLLEGKYTVYVEITDAQGDENAPVAFSNNAFASPVENVTETYSMPSATDVDPNPVMAFFYYLFFGVMFSDAGYGILLTIVCAALGFGKLLEKPKRKNFRMFFFCGISTTFWGFMFGGFFGNIVYTVSTTFFGKEISLAPVWLDPVSQAMNLLLFSVALGMVQILIGLGTKFYVLYRQGRTTDAVCDAGFWMVILLGICALAVGMGLQTPAFTTAGTWMAIAGAAGLLATGGRNSKNIFGKLFGGVV